MSTTIVTTTQTQTQTQKQLKKLAISAKTQELIDLELKYCAGGFQPLPAFFVRGKGCRLWDVDDKEYLDFLAMFSAVNTGQCNPKIMQAVTDSMQQITLSNLATHTASWGPLAKRLCTRFGYDKVIAGTSGSEATDQAVKIARKWGHVRKGIPMDEMLVFGVGDSFHGLTSGVWNLQNPSPKRTAYGLDNRLQSNVNPGAGESLTYGDIGAITRCLDVHHERVAAVIIESLHGGLRTSIEIAYSRAVYDLCRKYNILFIADEVRQGAGKTGQFFSFQHLGADVKPDMVCMGKSISGGIYPCSYVLGTDDCMSLVGTSENACTFGFTPMGIAATNATLDVIDDPEYIARGGRLGKWFQEIADAWKYPFITSAVGCGTDMCFWVNENHPDYPVTARKIGALCVQKGLLLIVMKNRVRMSPPVVLTDDEMREGMRILTEALDEVFDYDEVPGEVWLGPE